jgi:hypothetical protein
VSTAGLEVLLMTESKFRFTRFQVSGYGLIVSDDALSTTYSSARSIPAGRTRKLLPVQPARNVNPCSVAGGSV